MSKLSDAQITALRDLHEFNVFQAGTRKTTVQALVKAEMVFESVPFINGTDHGTYELTDAGRKAIGVEDEGIIERHKAEAREEFEALSEDIAEKAMDLDSDEAPIIPFFNRAARREFRRNRARANRFHMKDKGKRIRKFGVDNPKYFSRLAYRLAA